MISIVACCHSVKLCAHTARDFRSLGISEAHTVRDSDRGLIKRFFSDRGVIKMPQAPSNLVTPLHVTIV